MPGIARALVATEEAAKKEAEELLKAGAHVYRQDMSVEVPLVYSHLQMEAALCVWEWLNEITVVPKRGKANQTWLKYREDIGSVELRHYSIDIGLWALKVYDLLLICPPCPATVNSHTRGLAAQTGAKGYRKRLTSVKDFRRAMKSRSSGRKNALLKRPIGGSGSR